MAALFVFNSMDFLEVFCYYYLGLLFYYNCDLVCVGQWHRMWQRGIQMRRNIVAGNFQGWRLFSNTECPVAELLPTRDMNKVKQDLGEFPKLSTNDDLKIDWDDKHLVLFHFFRGEGESCTIRLWDIQVRVTLIKLPST